MNTHTSTIPTRPLEFDSPEPTTLDKATLPNNTFRKATIGAATLLFAAVGVAGIQIVRSDDEVQPAPKSRATTLTPDEYTRDLVARGVIPAQTLDPAPLTPDEYTRDLVARGVIPPQTLEVVTDAYTRDLAQRGVIPIQTLQPLAAS